MNGNASTNSSRLTPLLTVSLVIMGLYFAREFLLPLALAILISFLLAPIIRLLERWHFGRVLSVITATLLAFAVIGAIAFVMAGQVIDLANKLPGYKTNLRAKVTAFRSHQDGALSRARQTVEELTHEMTETPPTETASGKGGDTTKSADPSKPPPVPVSVVYTTGSATQMLREFVGPLLAPIGTAAIVIVFVIFMLLEREDLRDRVIHLIGRGHLQITTQALDEAGHRVSRYLLAQFIVNVTYGIPIAVGLYFIGIPNAILWGVLSAMLRFVPYLGAWISAAFPIALSLAVSPTWSIPLMTLGLFATVELISNNFVEPWLYGSSTGLTAMAIIVSAAFWTWLWGGVGLFLATPLTVCIAVIGKHIPSLYFLEVLLGDKPPIADEARFYQRLLAADDEEALSLAEDYTKEHGITATFDHLVVRTIRQSEHDFRMGELREDSRRDILRNLGLVLTELGEAPAAEPAGQVWCIPATNEVDELGARMLGRLVADQGLSVHILSSKLMSSEMLEAVVAAAPPVVCVSAVASQSLIAAAHLCKRIREQMPGALLLVGLWGECGDECVRRVERFKRVLVDHVSTTMEDAVNEIRVQPQLAARVTPAALVPEAAA